MGELFCCRKVVNLPATSQFLFQLNRFIPNTEKNLDIDKISNSSNNSLLSTSSKSDKNNDHKLSKAQKKNKYSKNLKENLIPNKGKYKFLFYDINQNVTLILEKKLDIIKSLEGLSELNFNQKLYLCGNSQLSDIVGSYLFEINPIDPKTNILVNSVYSHYYPALISIKNKFIFCIGGKNKVQCESYIIEENKWDPLPNLPEERYMCTLCYDSNKDILYLFGGINNKKQNDNKIYIESNSILRFKLGVEFLKWEKIEIKSENEKNLLKRNSSASLMFDDQKDNIYILGGENEQKHFLDNIIRFNTNTFGLQKINQKLKFPTIFFNQYGKRCEKNSYLYIFYDKFNSIFKVDKHDFVEFSYEKLEIKN